MKTLLLGSGNSREKRIVCPDSPDREFSELLTLDIDANCNPDFLWDLNDFPYPIFAKKFDEIHAYECLEHCGTQGDFRFFFKQFNEFHRILRPGGVFCGTVPLPTSIWAWGDPGHTRILPPPVFNYLQEPMYEQVGKTPVCDYRSYIDGWWEGRGSREGDDLFTFVLRAV